MTHQALRDLLRSLNRHPAFLELVRRLAPGQDVTLGLSGLTPTAKAIYLTLLWQSLERPLLVVGSNNHASEQMFELIQTFFELLLDGRNTPPPQLIPALDVLPSQGLSPHNEITEKRAVGLWRLAGERVPVTVTPIASALLKVEAADFYRQLAVRIRLNDELPLEDLTAHLESIGYERRDPVEMVGEFSIRGGILDVFPAEAPHPVRIEFFGDTVDSLRRFDAETQRSVTRIDHCTILPLEEVPRGRPLVAKLAELSGREGEFAGEPFPGWEFLVPLVRERTASLESLLPGAIVVWDEPDDLKTSAEKLWERLEATRELSPCPPEKIFFGWNELVCGNPSRTVIELRELAFENATDAVNLEISSAPASVFRGNMRQVVNEARAQVEQGRRVVFFAASNGEVERLADIFQEYSIPFQLSIDPASGVPGYLGERAYLAGATASTFLARGQVRHGAVLRDSGIALIGYEDLFGTSVAESRTTASKLRLSTFTSDLLELKPGDFVVHAEHGVGKFAGIRKIEQGDLTGDFMLIEYAGEARLYVPLTRMDLVEKYRGAGDATPSLDRLGGVTWARTRKRVKARMRDMAEELLKLYAQRKLAEGFAFSNDSAWQREFEDAFEFTPTRDQDTAMAEIKRDMENPSPMDRLLCGDVGFGKTEVAMRAAFKALGDGKQVAFLAPTTVLALQHFENLRRRFSVFPVRVEMLSRLRKTKEIKVILADIATGKVDIVIGTHRLLSRDVEFRDLGLLVVDEEQRFGVRHKERLKQLARGIDILTMSATPIPRTLHMSLLGIRDMSVIETPPKDRLAIQTVVARFNPELIRSAIEQEIGRAGQVYYIHNRIDTIFNRAAMIQQLAPGARVAVGHGQMGEAALEKLLLGFMRHDFDVLVCTTIAENGLDIPMANTILIENAERYGLSELYQLRGRVGRSNRRAYAYLLVPADTELTEVARKRLAALKEFGDLGAGFKIAALDLELRGAGNLLGAEQHGHIDAVGYDTYVRLLDETVREIKGEEVPVEVRSTLNLGLEIRIPADYITDEQQRLRAYKRIAGAGDGTLGPELLAEFEDRYGKPPEAVRNLLEFSQLRNLAQRLRIESAERRQGFLHLKFHEQSKVNPERLMEVVQEYEGAQFTPAGVLRVPAGRHLEADSPAASLLAHLKTVLLRLSEQ